MSSIKQVNGAGNSATNGYTLTALNRWSIQVKKLPPVEKIAAIHVYDFDNTLFQTPLPNPKIWNNTTISQLSTPDIFVNGGWWHDSRILAATGEGAEHEEKRGWNGWWNEKIVELVKLTEEQDDAIGVMLTGRSEKGFYDLIKRIIKSKGLEFDIVALKPTVGPNNERFRSTMEFKQVFLKTLMETYKDAKEIHIYEDRVKHVAGFRDFLADYNDRQSGLKGGPITRGPIHGEVIPVADISTTLDPVVEVAEVQHLINIHNTTVSERRALEGRNNRIERLAIKKTVFFTSYMIEPADTKQLIALLTTLAPEAKDLKYLANTILITPRPCPRNILEKIGGMNSKMKWKVAGIGSFDNNLWAARVEPVPSTAQYHTDNPFPSIVLGLRRGARPADASKIQSWQPVLADKSFVFETTVGEKVVLRIEPEDRNEDEYESLFPHKSTRRRFLGDEGGWRSRQHSGNHGNGNRSFHTSSHNQGRGGAENRGGRGGFRGGAARNNHRGGGKGGGGGFNKGSGRGGKGGGVHGYRSLDDVDNRDSNQAGAGFGNHNTGMVYDDVSFSALPQGPPPQQSLPHPHPHPPPPPPPLSYGQPYPPPQPGQWQMPGGAPPMQPRPAGGGGPDLQSFY
ncbi:hypothetical protein GGS23DRAFT_596391 [Durotheca rogersii]|uniref:uncharacterized protein n=1 Tax=Durotheca rogersii TaxID=419775 RepID=UPI00221E44A5|nr:uncharacterized protein GGS23DRAFT_596391 [Durotheca rogersii]KAI5863902.1 hypothetical protein GGS23DRAFT_596391 [Durotheca rogersii]